MPVFSAKKEQNRLLTNWNKIWLCVSMLPITQLTRLMCCRSYREMLPFSNLSTMLKYLLLQLNLGKIKVLIISV